MSEPMTRLGSMATLWRLTCQRDGTLPPHGVETIELRALSEAAAIDRLQQWRPDLRVLRVARMPTPTLTPTIA